MKPTVFFLAAALTISYAAVDVERTVQQVQSILQQNDLLPRLTRDEILQLLNDIRAEDAKSTESNEKPEITTQFSKSKELQLSEEFDTISNKYEESVKWNEINSDTQKNDISKDDMVVDEKESNASSSISQQDNIDTTTKSNQQTMMVVLPYTPRDGSSLQELYTKPPRVEVVPVPKPKNHSEVKRVNPNKNPQTLHETLKYNAQIANNAQTPAYPPDLQEFLTTHGISGKSGQDNFLLPLDGFKPLPLAQTVDGSVELPENIILTYDLISAGSESKATYHDNPQNGPMYEPLRAELPFDQPDSQSDSEKTVLPLDLPKSRKTKAINDPLSTDNGPIDNDSIKVIPLNQGPTPTDNEENTSSNELSKRQTENNGTETSTISNETSAIDTTVAPAEDSRLASTNDASAIDSSASITDLEESFGGAAPSLPGDSELPPPKKNGFYWMLDWNSFLEVGDGDTKVNIRFEPKLGDPQMFLPVNVP